MTDPQLRTTLHHLADEVAVVDLRPGVRARTRVLRRRRRTAALAAPAAAAMVAAVLLSPPSEPQSAPPADPTPAPTVDLAEAPVGGLGGAQLVVTDSDSRATWLVNTSGQAARLPVRVDSLPGARPALSSDGTVLSFGSPGTATLVRSEDGEVTEVGIPGGQEHYVSVSPDGRTMAYVSGDHADGIVLTLRPVDGTTSTTLKVTTSAAAGALVPVVWSDDGSSLLVLDGKGATRVDLRPTPRVGRGVYVRDDIVLANGWAAAPDLSRFAMSDAPPLGGRRTWLLLGSDDGNSDALTRPAEDRLIGWTADDRLVWWRRTADGYSVVTTDTTGRAPRTEMRLLSGLPNLQASWSEDRG